MKIRGGLLLAWVVAAPTVTHSYEIDGMRSVGFIELTIRSP